MGRVKVFITGGTGFVGGHLVRRLVKDGQIVRCLARPTSDVAALRSLGAEIVHGDVTDAASLKGAAEGCQAAVHCAALLGDWGRAEVDLERVNVLGTRLVARACRDAGVRRLVHVSTPGVVGIRGLAEATETDEPRPTGPYERTKWAAEQVVQGVARGSEMEVVVVRPDFVYGPGDRRRLELFERVRCGRFRLLGDGSARVRPTYVDDVIEGLLLALTLPAAAGEVFNIAGPRLVTFRGFVEAVARAVGGPPPKTVPTWMACAAAAVLRPAAWLLRRPPLVTAGRIRFVTVDHGTAIEKARRLLGYEPRVDLDEGLARTVAWYRAEGLLP